MKSAIFYPQYGEASAFKKGRARRGGFRSGDAKTTDFTDSTYREACSFGADKTMTVAQIRGRLAALRPVSGALGPDRDRP